VGPLFAAGLHALSQHPLVGDARACGLLGALELVASKERRTRFDPALKLPQRTFERGYQNGIVFRAFGDGTIGLAPALCCAEGEMEMIFARLRKTLDDLLAEPDIRRAMVS